MRMTAHYSRSEPNDAAPDLEIAILCYFDSLIAFILWHQEDAISLLAYTLQREFAFEAGNDDTTADAFGSPVDDHEGSPFSRTASATGQGNHEWASPPMPDQVSDKVYTAFDIVISGRWKARRNREGHDRTFQAGKTRRDEFDSQRLHVVFFFHVFGRVSVLHIARYKVKSFAATTTQDAV